jgi:hypothetical protein
MNNRELRNILNMLPDEPRLADIAMAIDEACPELIDHPTYKEWRRKAIAFEMQQNALIDELERREDYVPEDSPLHWLDKYTRGSC